MEKKRIHVPFLKNSRLRRLLLVVSRIIILFVIVAGIATTSRKREGNEGNYPVRNTFHHILLQKKARAMYAISRAMYAIL
jgi:hypothetical protein